MYNKRWTERSPHILFLPLVFSLLGSFSLFHQCFYNLKLAPGFGLESAMAQMVGGCIKAVLFVLFREKKGGEGN